MICLQLDPVWFDGFGGALVGAAATVIVVVGTIIHERRVRERNQLDTEIASAYAAATAHSFDTIVKGPNGTVASIQPMLAALMPAMLHAQRDEPELAGLLKDAADNLTALINQISNGPAGWEDYKKGVIVLQLVLSRWMLDPRQVRSGDLAFADIIRLSKFASPTGQVPDEIHRPYGPVKARWRRTINRIRLRRDAYRKALRRRRVERPHQ